LFLRQILPPAPDGAAPSLILCRNTGLHWAQIHERFNWIKSPEGKVRPHSAQTIDLELGSGGGLLFRAAFNGFQFFMPSRQTRVSLLISPEVKSSSSRESDTGPVC
jgi:hypothetical protein